MFYKLETTNMAMVRISEVILAKYVSWESEISENDVEKLITICHNY
jgi:hypothetical protein